jgi:hypothetical protein
VGGDRVKIVLESEDIKTILLAHIVRAHGVEVDDDSTYFEVDTAEVKDIDDIQGVRFIADI